MSAPEYIFEASSKPSLPWHEVPLIRATDESLKGYGQLVTDPATFDIEITRWPQQGWRGGVLYGGNEAVKGHYVLGWSADPQQAQTGRQTAPRDQVLLWHMNSHPDGGQLFFPLDCQPFIVPAALPGDNLYPDKAVAFWDDGSAGVWHEGVFPVGDTWRFLDRQGAVRARVSAEIGTEFGAYLSFPLRADKLKEL